MFPEGGYATEYPPFFFAGDLVFPERKYELQHRFVFHIMRRSPMIRPSTCIPVPDPDAGSIETGFRTDMRATLMKQNLVVFCIILSALVPPAKAKRLIGVEGVSAGEVASIEKTKDTRRLEQRLEPFLESVVKGPATATEPKAIQTPTQEELFEIFPK